MNGIRENVNGVGNNRIEESNGENDASCRLYYRKQARVLNVSGSRSSLQAYLRETHLPTLALTLLLGK